MNNRFDRVLLVRHFGICTGAFAAYWLQSEIPIGYTALWIVGIGALLNFGAFTFRTRPGFARACELASPVIGVGSWAALVAVTNGVDSPFKAGLWLEIVLSAMAVRPPGVAPVTAAAIAAMWVQQLWLGIAGHELDLMLQSGFMFGMGCAVFLVNRRFLRTRRTFETRQRELGDRLDALQTQLEGEQALGRVGEGENISRLAHGLKNVVHSLRGFATLIEPKLLDRRDNKALAGLRVAIDELEALAILTLEEGQTKTPEPSDKSVGTAPVRNARAVVQRAVRELAVSAPGIEVEITLRGESPALAISESAYRQILETLLRNAAEAMNGVGKAEVELKVEGGELCTRVSDRGSGLGADEIEKIFRPGYTTKDHGSGYGLFLAQRVARENGARLLATPSSEPRRAGEGAVFELWLPLAGDGSSGPQ